MAAGSGSSGCDATTLIDDVTGAVRILRRVVRVVAPGSIAGDQAVVLVDLLSEAERIVASGVARLTPRVMETGAFAKTGHACGADWLAAASGSSSGAARSRLAAAERAAVDRRWPVPCATANSRLPS
jgi:hypothetical protein